MSRTIFAGFGKLGYLSLLELIQSGLEIEFVLTHKDNSLESVDTLCLKNHIEYSYFDLRKDKILLEKLCSYKPEYLISVNYRYIIPGDLLRVSKYPLNLHGSLLPKYRGRTPHVWAIINGESKSGITCHKMEESVDTGEIYHQIEVNISEEDTGQTLLQKYEELYPICIKTTLQKISQSFKPIPQNHMAATYFGKRTPEMGYIDFTKDNQSLINFVRAQAKPYPGAYCFLPDGAKLIVHKAIRIDHFDAPDLSIGNVFKVGNNYIVKTNDGFLSFIETEIV
ncbi:methionyl-tRNA formyltransferase [Leptospira kanakyensis]|uniref:methionyl-tRNA formyltransferase n=1 Tax=Leptospira kanakyensis TaxID=2484968 RepID=UPI00223D2801|nr:methionyl-tRNA formyltransferase [Leptospira kanakyensis]MCW7471401.1 methionyl-tRNA formyltransferase [Leptospira kanakyensis]